MRGIGVVEALRGLPDIAVPVFALITQLGDVWFVFLVLSVWYWTGGLPQLRLSRRRTAFVIGLSLSGLALTAGLKQLFALPRPPMPGGVVGLRYVPDALHGVYIDAATADGYGFPSGHALLSTVVWGGLALVLDVGTRKFRAVAAGTVIGLVSLARVVLGVHYVVDVVAGVAVGLCYLAVVTTLGGNHARVALWLAVVVAVGSALVGPSAFDDVSTLGAAVGAAVTWELLDGRVPAYPETRWTGILTAAVGLVVLGGGFWALYALKPSNPVTPLATALIFVCVLGLPLAAARVEKRFGDTRTTQNVSR